MTINIKNKFSQDKKVYVSLYWEKYGYYKIDVLERRGFEYYMIAQSIPYADEKKARKAFSGYCSRYISK